MVLRLSYWRVLRRPEASRPSLASVGSTGARTGRSGAFKLANAASRIGGRHFGVDVCCWVCCKSLWARGDATFLGPCRRPRKNMWGAHSADRSRHRRLRQSRGDGYERRFPLTPAFTSIFAIPIFRLLQQYRPTAAHDGLRPRRPVSGVDLPRPHTRGANLLSPNTSESAGAAGAESTHASSASRRSPGG